MNKTKRKLIILLSVLLLPLSGHAKEKTLELKVGGIVEATYMKVVDNETLGKYYKLLIPLAEEYGARPWIDFSITSVESGKIRPNFIVLFEFPNSEDMEDFRGDRRVRKIQPLLVRATSGFYVEHVKAEKDMNFTFSDEKSYELYSLWINKENAKSLNTYFQRVGTTAVDFGAKFPISLKPVCFSSKGRLPSKFGISEWPNEDTKEAFLLSDVFVDNVHLRDKALDKMNLFTAKAVIY